jgi:predicted  nucleic acid-binding Zn-ribbon protein
MATVQDAEQLMAEGLTDVLKPIVQECDERLRAVFASQSDLAKQIDALNSEIEKFMDISKTPALHPYVQKLTQAKQRLIAINSTLTKVNTRLDRMQGHLAPPEKK